MSKRVLLVDDNDSVRNLLRLYMSSNGYRITEAQDGLDGLTKAKQQDFDIVVIDYKMPVMNGISLIKGLRELPQYAAQPFILLTTDDSAEFHSRMHHLTAVEVLAKPVEQSALLALMKKVSHHEQTLVA